MRSSIAIIISSILISGCTLMSFGGNGINSVPTVPHPRLAPIKYETCAGFEACFTSDEFNQLATEIAELKKESGR